MNTNLRLLVVAVLAVAGLVLLIVRFKLPAFLALLLASLCIGLGCGTDLPTITEAMADGVGRVLGSTAIIIGLGAIIGKLVAESGAAAVMAEAVLGRCDGWRLPWAMLFIGLLVGGAVWFTAGLVLLIPVVYALARRTGVSLLLPGIPMLAGLSVMHGLVPPHPGPMVAIGMLGADPGQTILYAVIVGLPTAAVAGPLLAGCVARRIRLEPGSLGAQLQAQSPAERPPPLALCVFTILLPVLLMLGVTVLDVALNATHNQANGAAAASLRPWVAFIGSPTVAMLVAALFSLYSFGGARGFDRRQLARFSEDALAPVATVLLIVGAGGAFSRVLEVCGAGKAVLRLTEGLQWSPLVLGWLAAALIRIAVGSATVAITTAAGIVAPLVAAAPASHPELVVVALGAGSLILSHVNDGGFWLVKEFFGMTLPQTFKTWTVIETVIAVVALLLSLLLDSIL
jgi:GntP family gluconate:H+ symporter